MVQRQRPATAVTVGYDISPVGNETEHYPKRALRAFLHNADNSAAQAQCKAPDGSGDGTVPTTSSGFNGTAPSSPAAPPDRTFPNLEHPPAYEQGPVQDRATIAITALAGLRFKEVKG